MSACRILTLAKNLVTLYRENTLVVDLEDLTVGKIADPRFFFVMQILTCDHVLTTEKTISHICIFPDG